jgi:hypothetical protein
MAQQRTRLRKPTTLAALLLLLPHLTGCTTTKMVRVAPTAAANSQLRKVHGVTTVDHEEVAFAEPGEVRNGTVYGIARIPYRSVGNRRTGVALTPYQIAISEVERLWLEEKVSGGKSAVQALAGLSALALVVAIAENSKSTNDWGRLFSTGP